jgi:metal-responsive CopG/Arc/MetJ family transcriptional regulator
MHTKAIRLNITLPNDLFDSLQSICGPRSRSRLIAESIRMYITNKQQADLEKTLEEGYRARAKESIAIADNFRSVDLEGWDEY